MLKGRSSTGTGTGTGTGTSLRAAEAKAIQRRRVHISAGTMAAAFILGAPVIAFAWRLSLRDQCTGEAESHHGAFGRWILQSGCRRSLRWLMSTPGLDAIFPVAVLIPAPMIQAILTATGATGASRTLVAMHLLTETTMLGSISNFPSRRRRRFRAPRSAGFARSALSIVWSKGAHVDERALFALPLI